MFVRELQTGLLVCPFDTAVKTGSYWLTCLKSRRMSPAMELFRDWILLQAAGERAAQEGG
jgi:LysR family transcriptional regulator of beta-lactamase